MRIILTLVFAIAVSCLPGCRCDPQPGRPAGNGPQGRGAESALSDGSGAPRTQDGKAAGAQGDPADKPLEPLPRYRAHKGAVTPGRLQRDYEDLTAHYRKLFARLVTAFKGAAASSTSLEQFFETVGPTLDRYDAARRNLRSDYSRVAHRERGSLNRDLARARARDKREKSMRHTRTFLTQDQERERTRATQVRNLQSVLDRAAVEVGRTFRLRFHEKLEGEVVTLRRRDSSPEETRLARERLARAIQKGFSKSSPEAQQRRRYAESWVGWFLRHKSEPIVAKKEEPPVETEHIVLRPARPDDPPAEAPAKKAPPEVGRKHGEPAAKKENQVPAARRPDIDLDCRNNECNLEQYRRFLARLPRSCPGSSLPDVLVKHCFPDFVHLDLSTPGRREIMNFIRFSGDNFFDRMRGLGYFEDICYKFRPVLELGDQMVQGDTSFTTDQKIRIREGLENIRRCR